MTARALIVSTAFHQAKLLEKPLLDSGFSVAVATNGPDGLALSRQRWADVVIVSGRQPGLDGFAFCRALRADPVLRSLPVGLIVDDNDPRQRFMALDAQADESLSFPLAAGNYLTCVRSLAELSDLARRLRDAGSDIGPEGFRTCATRILLLDADPRSRERLEEILSEEFGVVATSRAEDALACLAQEMFGLVLADWAHVANAGPVGSLLGQHLRLARLSGRLRLLGVGEGSEPAENLEGPSDGALSRPVDRNVTLVRIRTAFRKHTMEMALRQLAHAREGAPSQPTRPSGLPGLERIAA